MVWALRFVTLAGVAVALWCFNVFAFGYPDFTILFGFWAAAPLPFAYILTRPVARRPTSRKILLAGFGAALVLALWTYVDAVRGLRDGTESLSGLIVIFGPIYQYLLLTPFLLTALWIEIRTAPAR